VSFLLDTNIAIDLRDANEVVVAKVASLQGALLMSIVTYVELLGGVWREPSRSSVRQVRLEEMLPGFTILDFDAEAAVAYSRIVQLAGYSRRKLLDRMIAAQALVTGATLVTLNGEDFKDIAGLQLLSW
jgi:predicted nucleic acid-binding protein